MKTVADSKRGEGEDGGGAAAPIGLSNFSASPLFLYTAYKSITARLLTRTASVMRKYPRTLGDQAADSITLVILSAARYQPQPSADVNSSQSALLNQFQNYRQILDNWLIPPSFGHPKSACLSARPLTLWLCPWTSLEALPRDLRYRLVKSARHPLKKLDRNSGSAPA